MSSNTNDSKPENYQINAKICRLVERYPCMYDRQHPHYLKKDVVDKAWIKIAAEMDDSIPSCKERWRNIRTSFARSINVNKIPASANRTKPYYLHGELQFLAKHITPGIPVSRRRNSNNYCVSGEEGEVVEIAVGEESFDGFAAIFAEDDSQDQQSSADETVNEANSIENSNQEQQQQQIQQQQQQQVQPQQPSVQQLPPQTLQQQIPIPIPIAILPPPPPQQLIMEQEFKTEVVPQKIPMCPPKKRQRIIEPEPTIPEVVIQCERDVKPLESPVTPENNDFDSIFLQGLLPEMKAMNFHQKIIFKRRIYEVISEIFEHPSGTKPTQISGSMHTADAATSSGSCGEMQMINAADLALIQRLNTLLQGVATPTSSITSSTVTTIPKNVASISSTVRTSPVVPHRGAVTRSNASLLRTAMTSNNSSRAPSSTNSVGVLNGNQAVKQEPEGLDD